MDEFCIAEAKQIGEQKNKCWNHNVPACQIEKVF